MSFRIRDVDVPVFYVDNLDDGTEDPAEYDPSERIIKIRKDQKGNKRTSSQLHEFIHAFLDIFEYTLWLDDKTEEQFTRNLEVYLLKNWNMRKRKAVLEESESVY